MVASMTLLTACSGCGKEEMPPTTIVEETTVTDTVEETIEEIETVVEETTVEEVVEETTEEITKLETKYTIEKADVFAEANEESQILMTLDINHEVEVVGEVQDSEFTEIMFNEGTAFIKTVLLSSEKVEGYANWEESTEDSTAEEVPQEVIDEAKSQNEVTPQEQAPAPAPQGSNGQPSQALLDAASSLGFGLSSGATPNAPGTGEGAGYKTDKEIVLH